MKSSTHGASTSEVEVTNVSAHGLWLLVGDREYFLPYYKFPWFKDARLRDLFEVELLHGYHLHWPALDVDLELATLQNPEAFPLVDSKNAG
jgi:hypothetical protein